MKMPAYANLEGSSEEQIKKLKRLLGGTCVLLFGLALFSGIYIGTTRHHHHDHDACTSKACVDLADTLQESIDFSADPCEDFFQYACGGWIDNNDWALVERDSVSVFSELNKAEDRVFLDALFYDTDPDLVKNSAANKTQTFFKSCYYSNVDLEEVEKSELLQEFLTVVQFVDDSDSWNAQTQTDFNEAMAWTDARGWDTLYSLTVYESHYPMLSQNAYFWLYQYDTESFAAMVNSTVVPWYESYFGMNHSAAAEMGKRVAAFADEVSNITTADDSYFDYTQLYAQMAVTNITPNEFFGDSATLNYNSIMQHTFNTTLDQISGTVYIGPNAHDPEFFHSLIDVIENTPPSTVQYYIFAMVWIYTVNFENVLEQSRYTDRTHYCTATTVEEFPFVYGYIVGSEMSTASSNATIADMVDTVRLHGVGPNIDDCTWMDSESKANCDAKVGNLHKYVGMPPNILDPTMVSKYYKSATVDSNNFLQNLNAMTNFDAATMRRQFVGNDLNMVEPWPADFANKGTFPFWLTGINAFYMPSGNFFVIPVTISQKPFFAEEYPASINFGGLGSVIGHEMSHGFDPNGIRFDKDGNFVNDTIFSSASREAYLGHVQCYIDQYDTLEVEPGIYDDGNRTQTENVADNSGIAASFRAWKKWKPKGKEKLPGLDFSDKQLFFLGWSRAWCSAWVPGYYANWTNVHSPHNARVWGAVQNMEEFTDAFSCKKNSYMNPTDKCWLWA